MNFIKKDIEWLYNKAPYFKEFVEQLERRDVFKNGGYIAGGFLRRLYLNPDLIKEALSREERKVLNFKSLFEDFKSLFEDCDDVTAHQEPNFDLDIFCLDTNCVEKIKVELDMNEISFAGFAWQKHLQFKLENRKKIFSIKTQLIKNSVGPIEDILSRFDLYNSMIACDGKFIYMHEDFEKLEADKLIKLNRFNPFTLRRVAKYCNISGSSITLETKEQIIRDMFNVLIDIDNEDNEGFVKHFKYFENSDKQLAISSFKNFLVNTEQLKEEDIVMFIHKLGTIWITDDNYSGLHQEFVTALLINKDRIPKKAY